MNVYTEEEEEKKKKTVDFAIFTNFDSSSSAPYGTTIQEIGVS